MASNAYYSSLLAIIAYAELNYLKFAETTYIKNVGMMHNLLSFVILMLLVFGTNTSYDRWWKEEDYLAH